MKHQSIKAIKNVKRCMVVGIKYNIIRLLKLAMERTQEAAEPYADHS